MTQPEVCVTFLSTNVFSNPVREERIHEEVITVVAVDNVLGVERLKRLLDSRGGSKTVLFAARL